MQREGISDRLAPCHMGRAASRAHILLSLEAAPPVTLATRSAASSVLSSSSCFSRSPLLLARSSCTRSFIATPCAPRTSMPSAWRHPREATHFVERVGLSTGRQRRAPDRRTCWALWRPCWEVGAKARKRWRSSARAEGGAQVAPAQCASPLGARRHPAAQGFCNRRLSAHWLVGRHGRWQHERG